MKTMRDVLGTLVEKSVLQKGFKMSRLLLHFCGFSFAVRNVLNIKAL